jgi:hypothetical protein
MNIELAKEYSVKRNTHKNVHCKQCGITLGFNVYINEEKAWYNEPYCSSDCLQQAWILFQKKIKDQIKE